MKIKPNYMGPNLKTTHVYILYDNPDTKKSHRWSRSIGPLQGHMHCLIVIEF